MPGAVPVAAETVSVEVPLVPSTTDDGASVAVSPGAEAVSATVPVNFAMLATVIVEVPELPGANDKLVGLAVTLKLAGVTATGTVTL